MTKQTNTRKQLATPISSLADIKAKGGRKSIEQAIQAEMTKLDKSARAVITSYCNIGQHLTVAKAAVEANKQSWKMFMQDKPLGIAYSTAQRYIAAAAQGADKLLAQYDAQGSGSLNFKALLADTRESEQKAAGEAAHGNKGKSPNRKSKSPSAAAQPASEGGDDIGDGPITTVRVKNIAELDVPRMDAEQTEFLIHVLQEHMAELAAVDSTAEAA